MSIEGRIRRALVQQPRTIEALCVMTGLSRHQVQRAVDSLVIKGAILPLSGNRVMGLSREGEAIDPDPTPAPKRTSLYEGIISTLFECPSEERFADTVCPHEQAGLAERNATVMAFESKLFGGSGTEGDPAYNAALYHVIQAIRSGTQ